MPYDQWFYTQAGQQLGPVNLAELQKLAQAGQLRGEDLVWSEGMPDWAAAGSIPSLFPVTNAPPGYPSQIDYYTPQPSQFVWAGFWLRFCAVFVDGLLLYPITGLPSLLLEWSQRSIAWDETIYLMLAVLLQLAGYVIGWLYEAYMTSSKYQATLGKLAVGIKVVDEHGHRIGFGRATGRHFAKILSGLTLLIGYLMQPFTQRRQALHDLIAGTLVVKKSPTT